MTYHLASLTFDEPIMRFDVPESEKKSAAHPHEVFLINLITNHILLFVVFMTSANTYPLLPLLTPAISIVILAYILLRARKSLNDDPWFVMCHWQLSARWARIFIVMIAILAAIIGLLLWISGGDMEPQHYAVGGAVLLPVMVTVLGLIILESEGTHQARQGILPKSMVERYPNAEAVALEE
ncbi:MAG TPA: hypothetical protein VKA64_09665 [Gammaproteobacteria bacterium]|nr:hypothetical protein [Gammaproteobacteria bacterium]